MAVPTLSTWLQPGGTDRAKATEAILELYSRAGLRKPMVAWFSSPLAAMRELPRLVSRTAASRRREYGRLVTKGARPCLCLDCVGSSVVAEVVPVLDTLRANADLERSAIRIAGQVRRAVARELPVGIPDMSRHDGIAGPPDWRSIGDRPSWDIGWRPENQWVAAVRVQGQTGGPRDVAAPYAALAGSAGWWWLNDGIAVVSDRPLSLHLDERDRLHRRDGPAVVYEDGFYVNAIDGILLPVWYFDEGAITIDRIERHADLEVRRLLIERFGEGRYMDEAGGTLVHEDETGQLWSVVHEILHWHRWEIRMVRVIDATPQPHGSRRVYWLHVPPGLETARAAVAWTFGMTADEYAPIVET